MNPLFLMAALAAQPLGATGYQITPHMAANIFEERRQLEEWLRKNNPDAEIFIHPDPQVDKLEEAGFERVPFTWRGNKIWIRRKPHSDVYKKAIGRSA